MPGPSELATSFKLVGRNIFNGNNPSRLYSDKNSVKLINKVSFLLKKFVSNGKAKLPIILYLKNKIVKNIVKDKTIVLSNKFFLDRESLFSFVFFLLFANVFIIRSIKIGVQTINEEILILKQEIIHIKSNFLE